MLTLKVKRLKEKIQTKQFIIIYLQDICMFYLVYDNNDLPGIAMLFMS